jgi:hypothetical protein
MIGERLGTVLAGNSFMKTKLFVAPALRAVLVQGSAPDLANGLSMPAPSRFLIHPLNLDARTRPQSERLPSMEADRHEPGWALFWFGAELEN